MSIKKTKVMLPFATLVSLGRIEIGRGNLDYATQFRHLGSISSQGLSMQAEVSQRLAKAGHALHRVKQLFIDGNINRKVRCSVQDCESGPGTGSRYFMDVKPGQCHRKC